MTTTVKGRQVTVTPEIETMVERKLDKLKRLLNDSIVSINVVLAQERHDCTAELVLHARGDHMLHGSGNGSTWAQAVTTAVEKVDQQAHTLKGKWAQRHRRSGGESSSL